MIKYTPLNTSLSEFRLVKLKSKSYGPPESPLVQSDEENHLYCELSHHSLNGRPSYNALSYVWGDDSDRQAIYVNSGQTLVTENLRAALEHLQDPDKDVMIWIDALCINQADDEEKTQQVKQMTKIYAMAACTMAWLGCADEYSGIAMAETRKIGAHIECHNGLRLFHELEELSRNTDSARYKAVEKEICDLMSEFLSSALCDPFPSAAFNNLLARPYWKRAWVLQEQVVASRVEIICGNAKVPFQIFESALLFVPLLRIHVVTTLGRKMQNDGESASWDYVMAMSEAPPMGASRLCGMRRRFQESSNSRLETLFRLLVRAHVDNVTQAKDPRDKIFALLGMATDTASLRASPNYGESATLAYTKIARAIIESGHVDLLSLCQFPKSESGQALPSWVPDWCATLGTPCGQLPWDTTFHASGAYSFQQSSTKHALSPTQLRVQGCRVDIVKTTRAAWTPGPDGCTKNTREVAKYLMDVIDLCSLSIDIAKKHGVELYTDAKTELEVPVHIRVPIADLEQDDICFIRRATQKSSIGQQMVLKDVNAILRGREQDRPEQCKEMSSYYNMMGRLRFRRPFISEKGFVGLGPACLEEGDAIVVILGAKLPYILRRTGNEVDTYTLVGEAYVHGIMYGEFMQSDAEFQQFVLI